MRKKLGSMLVDADLISDVQLNAALHDQRIWGGRLGTHLVKMGILSEEELVAFLARQMNIPSINFRKSKIFAEALELVTRDVCEKWCVIPVAFKDVKGKRQLMLAMADTTNIGAISEIEFHTNCSVMPVVAAESDILKAIDYCYSSEGIRDSTGLGIHLESESYPTGKQEEAAVLFSGGEERIFHPQDQEMDENSLRAVIEILFEKKIIQPDEFHAKIEQLARTKNERR